jgi:hypothetical protein
MKEKDKARLYTDLDKYCNQIGILPEEKPTLILDRQQYSDLRKSIGSRGVRKQRYGECNRTQRAIFVNSRTSDYQIVRYMTKLGRKRTGCSYKTVKATYRHKLNTLVHELVHYRFPSMQHGLAFENRIKEILKGRQFEPKAVLSYINKGFEWRLPGITGLPHMSIEHRIERVKKSAEFLHKHNIQNIMPELIAKYSKYIDQKEIESGFNLFLQQQITTDSN